MHDVIIGIALFTLYMFGVFCFYMFMCVTAPDTVDTSDVLDHIHTEGSE